jgi:hypothetical protein
MLNGPGFTRDPCFGGGIYPSRLIPSCVDVDGGVPGALEREHGRGDEIQDEAWFGLVHKLVESVDGRWYLCRVSK